ncbi:Wadjet anti-phage system protein JetD domain-containing protein [Micromonospora profundi]|uniref:Wadjet anti-phage system protein JetD domain-containing protein n=1 Tax=Micromonospora profundi TaxID=1420889 RepID=UPI00367B876D
MAKRTDQLAEALYDKLREWATAKRWRGTTLKAVPIDEVRRCFHAVYQRREGDDAATAMLRASLSVLAERAQIVPVRATDSERIALPQKIKLVPVAPKTRRIVPPMPRWHPQMYDLEDAWPTATDKQRVRYEAINRWLLSNPDTTLVPLRERALEIFSASGDEEGFPSPEKALDGMRDGPLFGDQERLLRLLHAVATPPPLLSKRVLTKVAANHWTHVGDGDLLLVVENSATWWSIVKALPASHNVGHVAWGLGASFMASVRSIADNHEIRRIRYFGDVDLSGLRIPDSAQRTACAAGLPQVRPAVRLYAELFATGRSWRAGDNAVEEGRARSLVGWLPEEHHDAAARLLVEGRRIAQEWVGYRHLVRTRTWHTDLL